ncbi:MAG TPA: flagellar biosynthesis protein FlhF [Tepidisphaeraceae bacterium]|nr:flagellar biosynthesis protein FlhF [Tepidisphaeraceae bacterium]
MSLQTFKAATMAQALAQVKITLGSDAVIMHTRQYQLSRWLGLRRQEVVEIVAGRGADLGRARRPKLRQTPPPAPLGYAANTNAARTLLETPAVQRAMMFDLSSQMQCIKTMVKDLSSQVRHQSKPQVPEELFDYYTQLVSRQVCQDLALEVINAVQKEIRPENLGQSQWVKERLLDHIQKLIPVSGAIERSKREGPHVVALIGPTGVGKTTTIAKLAANLKLREKRRVGLITIDTYRIAAVDQLKKYADILGSNLRVVASPDELRSAVNSMSDNEFVLIDTAGRSPNDALKLHELRNFLASACPDETHLVLSATASQCCLELAVERFGEMRIDRMIFTKLDEAAHAGIMLNILRRVGKPLSYVTTGQDVPDDIEVGRTKRLAEMILK